jgi:hypothetical protein
MTDEQYMAAVQQRESAVAAALSGKQNGEAIRVAVSEPPFGTKNMDIKVG